MGVWIIDTGSGEVLEESKPTEEAKKPKLRIPDTQLQLELVIPNAKPNRAKNRSKL